MGLNYKIQAQHYARKITERDPTDVHLYSRIMAHWRAGILSLKDLKEGIYA